jgi:hypothetical protein
MADYGGQNISRAFNVPSPYQTEQRRIEQQQKMAEMLQAQSMQPNERFSYNGIEARIPATAGLAKMLQGFTGMMMQKKGLEEEKALGEKYQAQSAGEARDFLSALRGTPAVPEKAMPQTSFAPSGSDLTDVNVPRVPEGYENTGNIIQLAYKVPAVAGVPADRGKALGLAMQSINPMIQSAGGALLAAEMPKATKWEKVELPTPEGGKRVGFVDINSPNPEATFRLGGQQGPKSELVNVGGEMVPRTGFESNQQPITRTVSPDTKATLAQTQALADRAFNNLSVPQQAQDRREAQRLGLSIQDYNLKKWQAENPTPQIIQSGSGFTTVQPRTGIASPVVGAVGTPIAGPQRAAPEAYTKKADALLNMNDALENYGEKLVGFSNLSMLRPDERAKIGNAYQNTLLQAKEIYNLGVLNGPDKQILEQIIANPIDFRTAAISTDALIKQVDAMKNIIQNQNTNLSKVYGQPEITFNKKLTAVDAAAMEWVKANPNDPRSAAIKKKLGQE